MIVSSTNSPRERLAVRRLRNRHIPNALVALQVNQLYSLGFFMTPVQSRMARAGLNWNAGDLALAAGVSRKAVMRFENHSTGGPAVRIAFTRSLEAAGVQFIRHRNRIGVMLITSGQDDQSEG